VVALHSTITKDVGGVGKCCQIFPDAVGSSVEKVIDSIAPGRGRLVACKLAQRKLPVDLPAGVFLVERFREYPDAV
jgi:hypothetical protein